MVDLIGFALLDSIQANQSILFLDARANCSSCTTPTWRRGTSDSGEKNAVCCVLLFGDQSSSSFQNSTRLVILRVIVAVVEVT